MSAKLPRGIRNNNPGNLEWGEPWQGLVPPAQQTDPRFCQFVSPVYGIRAMARVLITYQDKRRAEDGSRIDTVREIVARWAPSFENNTNAYTQQVANAVCTGAGSCTGPDDPSLSLHDYKTLRPIVEAIIRHENGPGGVKSDNTWYTPAEIEEGLRLAGVQPTVAAPAGVPVTKETVGATTTAAIGVAQLAEVAPQIVAALDKSNTDLSSGSIVRIVLGLLTIAFAVFIAYAQVKKHQKGTL